MKHRYYWFCVVVGVICMGGCRACLCGNEVVAEFSSPSGKLKAVVFDRTCGPPSECALEVSIIRAGEAVGNTDANAVVFGEWHGLADPRDINALPIRVGWVGDSRLEISYDVQLEVSSSEKLVNGVQVGLNKRATGS